MKNVNAYCVQERKVGKMKNVNVYCVQERKVGKMKNVNVCSRKKERGRYMGRIGKGGDREGERMKEGGRKELERENKEKCVEDLRS